MFRVLVAVVCMSYMSIAHCALLEDSSLVSDSKRVFHTGPALQDYRLVKSDLKKVNNLWRAKEERIAAVVERSTYLLNEPISYAEALKTLKSTLSSNKHYRSLFTCECFDCGSSNGWANEYFGIKQLYGLDVYQYYTVVDTTGDSSQQTVEVLYLVQRGNRQVYFQRDSLQLQATQAKRTEDSEVERMLTSQGAVYVMSVSSASTLSSDELAEFKHLVLRLKANPAWHLRVVGHHYKAASLAENLSISQRMAQELADKFLELGVANTQVSAHGVGNLVPSGRSDAAVRLDLVLDTKN